MTIQTSSASTNRQTATMIQSSSVWKFSICSITGEAAGWKPIW